MLIAVSVLVVLVVGILVVASTKPNEFRIQRSARINAPAERIMPHIEDFSQWVKWSQYDSLDPDMIDERARAMLDYVDPRDLVLLLKDR